MHILLTSAHGFVGSRITPLLLAKGHTVSGLARSPASASKATSLGAQPISLSLEQPDAIADWIKSASPPIDAVIHTAFVHDFTKYVENCQIDRAVVDAIAVALEGSNRPLIITSGMFTPQEDLPVAPQDPNIRGQNETYYLGLAESKDVKTMVVRLPPTVHGNNDWGFVPMLIDFARKKGKAAYLSSGEGVWSAVHVEDAAQLYVDVLEKGTAGHRYHAVHDTGVPMKDIIELFGKKLDVPVEATDLDGVQAYAGFLAGFMTRNMSARSDVTRQEVGWAPRGKGLIQDLEEGDYFDTKA